jgi:ParB family chromosome partitioning protein
LEGKPVDVTVEEQATIDALNAEHDRLEAEYQDAYELPDAVESERRFARVVVAWPRRLLFADATYRDPSGHGRHERLVGIEAVVGTDGRLHRPKLKASIDRAHEAAIQGALSFWRFEPARRADAPVGARVPLEIVLRVY